MIMPKIGLEWTAQSNIRTEAVQLAQPILEAVALQAIRTRKRILKTGKSGTGRRFRRYAETTRKVRRRLGLQNSYKDFRRTGTFWRSMKVKLQSPTKATAVFTGRSAKGTKKTKKGKVVRVTNAALARILNAKESESIFATGDREIGSVALYLAGRLTLDIFTAQSLEETDFQKARKARSDKRKARAAIQALRG